jgi:peptidoglycan hydrolase CwlO-like protein
MEKLRDQANAQQETLEAQEAEVHGKQQALDDLKDEEKKLLEEIKASEKEIKKFGHDLEACIEINAEVLN